MPTTTPVELPIHIDMKGTEKGFRQIEKSISKSMRDAGKTSQKSMSKLGKAIFDMGSKITGVEKKFSKVAHKIAKNEKDLRKEFYATTQAIKMQQRALGQGDKEQDEATRDAIKKLKKENQERLRSLDSIRETKKELHEKIKEEMVVRTDKATKEIKDTFSAFVNRDAEGVFKSGGALVGKGIEKSFQAGASGLKGVAKFLTKKGDSLWDKSKQAHEKGGVLKKGASALGGFAAGGMKGLGGIMKGIAPLLNGLSKLGPILTGVTSMIAGIVKLFIDAEATVKEINKEVLATSSTSAFLAGNFGNASAAAADLKSTLADISDAALDARSNLDWSITKEDHKAVLSSLGAEGVTLKTLEKEYGALNAESKEYSNTFGSVTQMAVAYSRLMGVSLQEVTQLQGEMMTEMGSSLIDTQKAFQLMGREAAESGISANKFFSMIRGVSADLSLYNTRMEDAVKLLGRLGKIMNPRNAQQFMSFAMNAVKGMGRIQRLQTTLLAGGDKVGKIVQKDIEDKSKSIAQQIATATNGNAAELEKAIKAGDRKTISEAIAKAAPESQGALSEAVSRLGIEKKRAGKGVYGVAQAAGMVTPARQISIIDAALSKWGEPGDIGYEQMAENMGISVEQVEALEQMKDAVKSQREILVQQAKDAGDTKKAAYWQSASLDDVYDTLDAGQKQSIEEDKAAADQEAKFAKDQGKNVSTIMDKLGTLVDWFMGQFYDAFISLLDHFGVSAATQMKADRDFIKTMKESNDPSIRAATKAASTADPGKAGDAFRDALMKDPAWQKIASFMETKQTDPKQEEKRQGMIAKSVDAMSESQAKSAFAMSKGKGSFEELGPDLQKTFNDAMYESVKSTKHIKGHSGRGGEYMPDQDIEVTDQKFKGGAGAYDRLKGAVGEDTTATMAAKGGWASGGIDDLKQFASTLTGLKSDMTSKPEDTKPLFDMAADAKKQATYLKDAAPFYDMGMTEGSIYVHDTHAEKVLKSLPGAYDSALSDGTVADTTQETSDTLGDIYKALRNRGIKVEKFVGDHVKDTIHDAVLDAVNESLYDYYILTHTKGWEKYMKDNNLTGAGALAGAGKWAKDTQETGGDLHLKENAAGGIVTSITDGMAQVRAAPGEGLASVGPGEAIVPAGGGGGGGGPVKVELSLKGDLGRIIDARADDRYAVNRSKERLR